MKSPKTITLILSTLIAFLCVGCDVKPRERGEYYNRYKLDVNCGEKFKGTVYEQAHSTAAIYSILYALPDGKSIDLPDGCVIITLEEYMYAKEAPNKLILSGLNK